MKAVDVSQNQDGTWTARIFSLTYTAKTREECVQWLRMQGEDV
jgi:hypothetical protein